MINFKVLVKIQPKQVMQSEMPLWEWRVSVQWCTRYQNYVLAVVLIRFEHQQNTKQTEILCSFVSSIYSVRPPASLLQ